MRKDFINFPIEENSGELNSGDYIIGIMKEISSLISSIIERGKSFYEDPRLEKDLTAKKEELDKEYLKNKIISLSNFYEKQNKDILRLRKNIKLLENDENFQKIEDEYREKVESIQDDFLHRSELELFAVKLYIDSLYDLL